MPIHAEESVLAEAGIVIPDEQEDEVEKFREFLDSISPEDFRGARLNRRSRGGAAGAPTCPPPVVGGGAPR